MNISKYLRNRISINGDHFYYVVKDGYDSYNYFHYKYTVLFKELKKKTTFFGLISLSEEPDILFSVMFDLKNTNISMKIASIEINNAYNKYKEREKRKQEIKKGEIINEKENNN